MTSTIATLRETNAFNGADEVIFARLEAEFGDTVRDVLELYFLNSDSLCERLQGAASCAYWQEAVRTALRIGHEAEALGFHRIAKAARGFADATYHADSPLALRNGAQAVVFEYERLRLALEARFGVAVASDRASVA
jgi:hypothetical protein